MLLGQLLKQSTDGRRKALMNRCLRSSELGFVNVGFGAFLSVIFGGGIFKSLASLELKGGLQFAPTIMGSGCTGVWAASPDQELPNRDSLRTLQDAYLGSWTLEILAMLAD